MKNRFSLRGLQIGEEIFLRGENNNYFLVRGNDPRRKRYRIDAGTDIGHCLRDRAGYTGGLLKVIEVAIHGMNIALETIDMQLVFRGYFRRDGTEFTRDRTHDGVEALVDGLLAGHIHGRYIVESTPSS